MSVLAEVSQIVLDLVRVFSAAISSVMRRFYQLADWGGPTGTGNLTVLQQ